MDLNYELYLITDRRFLKGRELKKSCRRCYPRRSNYSTG